MKTSTGGLAAESAPNRKLGGCVVDALPVVAVAATVAGAPVLLEANANGTAAAVGAAWPNENDGVAEILAGSDAEDGAGIALPKVNALALVVAVVAEGANENEVPVGDDAADDGVARVEPNEKGVVVASEPSAAACEPKLNVVAADFGAADADFAGSNEKLVVSFAAASAVESDEDFAPP